MPQVSTVPLAVPSVVSIAAVTPAACAAGPPVAAASAAARIVVANGFLEPIVVSLICVFGCVVGRASSEEAELVRVVAHEQVLGLLVVLEHHLVGLAADARLLVAP